MLVQLVMAAMSTVPWFKVYSWPSRVNGTVVSNLSLDMAYPLKPTGLLKHAKKSVFISLTATLSWGLLGPEQLKKGINQKSNCTVIKPRKNEVEEL